MNKLICLKNRIRDLINWIKNHWNWGLAVLIPLTIFLLFYAWPKSSAIYFDGTTDQATFSFCSERQIAYSVKSDTEHNGKVVFENDGTELILAVKTSSPEETFQQAREGKYSNQELSREVFAFDDGKATLSSFAPDPQSKPRMTITLKPPEGGSFTYDMEVTRDEGDGNGEWNQIELKNFSKDIAIELSSACDINMKGTGETMPAMLYQIFGCKSIKFYAVPAISEDPEIGYNSRFKEPLKSFQFTNTERDTIEITYRAETNFVEIGHVEMEGTVQPDQELMLEISDMGQYPLPVKLSGQVGKLTMGGVNCYPNPAQWVLDKRSELLLSIAALFIGLMFKIAEDKKPVKEGKNDSNHTDGN